ncbi:hypothetical protein RB595_008991 [Gaeumannomyces hyphopodioides]
MSDRSNSQGSWQTVSRYFGAGTVSAAGSGTPASPMDRWLAEPSRFSPHNNIGQVRQGRNASTSPPPAPSTNHATSGSTKQ